MNKELQTKSTGVAGNVIVNEDDIYIYDRDV